jgi:hypothetical protein
LKKKKKKKEEQKFIRRLEQVETMRLPQLPPFVSQHLFFVLRSDRQRQERKHRLVQDQELLRAEQAGLKAPKLVQEPERSYASLSSSYVLSELEPEHQLKVQSPELKEYQPPVKERAERSEV